MPEKRHTNAGAHANRSKRVAQGSFGSYLATNFEREVAALNRAGSRSAQPKAAASSKINGVVIGSAIVIVISVIGVIAMGNYMMGKRNANQQVEPQHPQLHFNTNLQTKVPGFSARKRYRLERPPNFVEPKKVKKRYPIRQPASVD